MGDGRPAPPLLFFFFQAEDGIRDVAVTGVQTCALPIWAAARWLRRRAELYAAAGAGGHRLHTGAGDPSATGRDGHRATVRDRDRGRPPKIGRASCRERV